MNRKIKIEFNETSDISLLFRVNDLSGKVVDEKIIDEFIFAEEIIEEAKYQQVYPGGYFKTYFYFYEDEKEVKEIRIDLGDGLKVNQQYYDYLKKFLKGEKLI